MTAQENAGASVVLHATCVAAGDRGLLILGRSGAGKSALALNLIALGAALVSDDRVRVTALDGTLQATCPSPAGQGLIEARGFGLLRLAFQPAARLILALDLDQPEPDRLPQPRQTSLLGVSLPLARRPRGDHLSHALWCHLQGAPRELGV